MKSLPARASLVMFALASASLATAAPVDVSSPGGIIKVQVQTDTDGALTWSVQRRDRPVLSPAPLGLTIDGVDIGKAVTLGAPRTRTIQEKYPTFGNHAIATNHCNEAIIPAQTSAGTKFEVAVRAFDDGAAVRFHVTLAQGEHTIAGETTAWSLPTESRIWWMRYDPGYERNFESGVLSAIPDRTPLSPPITFRTPDSLYVALTEADNASFPDMGIQRIGPILQAVFPASARGWRVQGDVVTPWRLALITEDLNALVNSDIVTNLCPPPPPELANADWIKPGRSLWQWWAIGAPKLDDQKQWVDAAKRLGFEYYLIDDGWRTWRTQDKDQWQCLKEVIDYGKSQGVESLVWVNSSEMRTDATRRAYLERVAALGAAGIKIDFIPAPTPEIMRWYEGALKDTAELKLLCNFHGAVKPTGRRRTWPHEFTREAVRGLEYHMTRYRRVLPAPHDQTVLFTRYLAGPADYTPTTFDPGQLVGYTWSHMLAQAVTMTSPLLHFGGGYKDFLDNPAEEFLRKLPATWDQTIVLPGSEIGEIAGFARRRGNDWFIGVLNGLNPATLAIDLSFLGSGRFQAEIFADEPEKLAAFKRETKAVTSSDKLAIPMSTRGGLVVWLKKAGD